MPIVPLEIGTQSNPGRYGQSGSARLINCYPEEAGKEGKHPIPVYASAGLAAFATLTDGGAVRCLIDLDAYLYVTAGRAIYRVDTTGTGGASPIGGMASDGIVTMASNRAGEISVVCDGIVKIITGLTVTDLADSDLPPPNSVHYNGGYHVYTHPSGRFSWSGIDNASVFDALDFATAESSRDGLLMGKALGQHSVLFGTRSIEFWILSGGADSPFTRSHVINVGCFAAGSVSPVPIVTQTAVTDSIAFAATDAQGAFSGVCIVENLSARKISTHSVDRSIRDEPDVSSITSCSWSDGGHAFYSISGSTFSWCWDSANGQWHERRSYGLDRWKVRSVQQFGGGLIAGDYTSNNLYRMSNTLTSEGDDPLILTIQPPPVHAFPESLEFAGIYVDVIPGVGLASGDAHDIEPEMMVSWSDDGTNFVGNRLIKIGRMGETIKRAKTTRLGQSKRGGGGRTFRFSVSADVVKGIMGAAIDVNKVAAA
jgi:hypothetical protein